MLSLLDIGPSLARVAELRKQCAGVSFAARQYSLRLLETTIYDSKSSLLNTNLMTMRLIQDKLKQVGVMIPDDVFALHVANLIPGEFLDVSIYFEGRLLN